MEIKPLKDKDGNEVGTLTVTHCSFCGNNKIVLPIKDMRICYSCFTEYFKKYHIQLINIGEINKGGK